MLAGGSRPSGVGKEVVKPCLTRFKYQREFWFGLGGSGPCLLDQVLFFW